MCNHNNQANNSPNSPLSPTPFPSYSSSTQWAWDSQDPSAANAAALKALDRWGSLTRRKTPSDKEAHDIEDTSYKGSRSKLSKVFNPMDKKPEVGKKRPTSGWVSLSHMTAVHEEEESEEGGEIKSWGDLAKKLNVEAEFVKVCCAGEKKDSSSSPALSMLGWEEDSLDMSHFDNENSNSASLTRTPSPPWREEFDGLSLPRGWVGLDT